MRPVPTLSKYLEGEQLVLWLPFPPSVNHYWETSVVNLGPPRGREALFKKGRNRFKINRHVGERGRKFRQDVLEYCLVNQIREKFTGPVSVQIDYFPPTAGTYDQDNFSKALLDALTHAGIWSDDSQAVRSYAAMWPKQVIDGKVRTCTRVEIRALTDVPLKYDFADYNSPF